MKHTLLLILTAVAGLAACSSYEAPDSAMDAGRQFVNATYQGNFKRARQLLATDDASRQWLQALENSFRNGDGLRRDALSKASINIRSFRPEGDTAATLEYLNVYDNQLTRLRCRLQPDGWVVLLQP
jgi:hypothetical protein